MQQRSVRLVLALAAVALAGGVVAMLVRARSPSEALPPRDAEGRPAAPIVETPQDKPLLEAAVPEPADRLIGERVPAEVKPEQGLRTMKLRVLEHGSADPIAGARVTGSEEVAPASQVTNELGECMVQFPVDYTGVPLTIEMDGYFHRTGFLQPLDEQDVPLHRTTTLVGRILAADTGEPLPHASLSMRHRTCSDCEPSRAQVDADGRYEFTGVPIRWRHTTFLLAAEGFPQQRRRFEVRSGEERTSHDFQLERGVEVQGRVVDLVTGSGIPGATVSGQKADESGYFTIQALPHESRPTEIGLRFEAEGYCQLMATYVVEEVKGRSVEVRLPRGAIVEGTVRDEAGKSVEGALVRLNEDHAVRARQRTAHTGPLEDLDRGWRLNPEGYHASARTDASGRFAVTNAVPWTLGWKLCAYADGFEAVALPLEETPGAEERMWRDIVLVAKDEDHLASVGGEVTVNGFGRTLSGKVFWTIGEDSGEATVSRGDYSVAVPAGSVELRFEIQGLPHPIEGDTVALTLSAGEGLVHNAELTVPTATIAGRVHYASPYEPAEGKTVTASCSLSAKARGYWGEVHYSARTEANGTYEVTVPDWARPYRVHVRHATEDYEVTGVEPGATGVDLALARTSRVLVRATAKGDHRVLDLRWNKLAWRRSGEQSFRRLSTRGSRSPDRDGWYEFHFPAGYYDFLLEERGDQARSIVESVYVAPGEEPTRVELEVTTGLELVLEAGTPGDLPEGCTLFLIEEAEWEDGAVPHHLLLAGSMASRRFCHRIAFDAEGRCVLKGLAPGPYLLKATREELVIAPEAIEFTESGPERVEVRWSSGE